MKYFSAFVLAFLICLSCASIKDAGEAQKTLLPLKDGWYQCDFERTLKGIEVEHDFTMNTGMDMIYEVTYKYHAVVERVYNEETNTAFVLAQMPVDYTGVFP